MIYTSSSAYAKPGSQPSISIVTVCLNDLCGLQDTFESVRAQTAPPAQWIVADGASSGSANATVRQDLMRVYSEERIRAWTNERVRAQMRAGRAPGPESSIGKVHQGDLNQRIQALAVRLLDMDAVAWQSAANDYAGALPFEVRGMLRSVANTIEGGTTEINKNVLGERVLGLPREPDPWQGRAWREVPRS